MAQQAAINGTNMNVTANWVDIPAGNYFNGKTSRNRWRRHVWTVNVMTESEYNTLQSLEGQKVSITTTNYNDRNGDYITYYEVDFLRISAAHNGPRFENVNAEFRVLV